MLKCLSKMRIYTTLLLFMHSSHCCSAMHEVDNKRASSWQECYDESRNCWKPLCEANYTGTRSETVTGLKCQRWDAQRPWNNLNQSYPHNHCLSIARIEGDYLPWCYSSSGDVPEETCFSICDADEDTCFNKNENCWSSSHNCQLRETYHGKQNVSRENEPCKPWEGSNNHSYCRVKNIEIGPACFTNTRAFLSPCMRFCGEMSTDLITDDWAHSLRNFSVFESATGSVSCICLLLWLILLYLLKCPNCLSKSRIEKLHGICLTVVEYIYDVFIVIKDNSSMKRKTIYAGLFNILILYVAHVSLAEVKKYLNRDTEMIIEVVNLAQMRIPDVMVCMHGRRNDTATRKIPIFNNSMWEFAFFWSRVANLYVAEISDRYARKHFEDFARKHLVYLEYEIGNPPADITISTLHQVLPKCENFVKECYDNDHRIDCCSNVEHILSEFGQCPIIKGVDQKRVGSAFEMVIEIPETTLEQPSIGMPMNHGFQLTLRDTVTSRFDMSHILVSAGFFTQVTIRKVTQYKKLNRAGSPCSEDKGYNIRQCQLKCLTMGNREKCNCTTLDSCTNDDLLNLTKLVFCIKPSSLQCFTEKMLYDFNDEHFLEEILAYCQAHCPVACEYAEFDKYVTHARLTSNNLPWLKSARLPNSRNRAVVKFTYERLEITVMTETYTEDIRKLFSRCGGIVGAWLGYSVTTCVYVLLNVVLDLITGLRRTQKRLFS